jgi:hypothetical protein
MSRAMLSLLAAWALAAPAAAQFSATKQSFPFASEKGEVARELWVLKDGDKFLGVYDEANWQLDYFAFDKSQARSELTMPYIYSWATLLGTRLNTCAWWDRWGSSGDRTRQDIRASADQIVIDTFEEWSKSRQAQSVYTLTLKRDGDNYVWHIYTAVSTDKLPEGKREIELLNIQPRNISSPWPDESEYHFTVLETVDGTVGWPSNLPAADRSDRKPLRVREGGFTAFMPDREGKGVALTQLNTSEATFNKTCNLWMDQHNMIQFPQKPDADGKYRVEAKWELHGLSQNQVAGTLASMKPLEFGDRAVMIRLGVPESFDDQPNTTTVRGLWNWGHKVSDKHARSGKLSFEVDAAEKITGDVGRHIAPFVRLDENSTYQLDCWVMVEGDAEAYISIGPATSDVKQIGVRRTEGVRAADGWKQISLTLTTGRGGREAQPRFIATGKGKAYFDDFHFRKINPTEEPK